MNTENNKLKFIIPAILLILLILPVVLERQTKMKKSILLAMFISAFLICMSLSACFHSGIQQEAMESGWYQMQLSEVRKDNSKQPPSNDPDGKEIWLIEVDAVESHQILARWRKCLYSKNKVFLGYCIRGENRFFLKTNFLKTRLKKDDVILFTVKHRTVRSWLEGTVTIHQIDGNAMAKLNPDTGEFVPLVSRLRNLPRRAAGEASGGPCHSWLRRHLDAGGDGGFCNREGDLGDVEGRTERKNVQSLEP